MKACVRLPAWLRLFSAGCLLAMLGGCAGLAQDAAYLWQSVNGHLHLMAAARPVDDWLADAGASAALKSRLVLSQRMRDFASRELGLPDNPSYRRYADLHRTAAVWNVVAAPAHSLVLKTWCFAFTGCVGYRGYFDPERAREFADDLRLQGLDVDVYPVPAYSTLGYMNWAGGDPLLNTWINYPEPEMARLIFHELAHQVVYVGGDTEFNESFATAVERLGGERWLALQGNDAMRAADQALERQRLAFRALVRATRDRLEAIYSGPLAAPAQEDAKQAALRDFRAGYAQLKQVWGGTPSRYASWDAWVAHANNASFGAQAAYDRLVPGFEALFIRQGRDWPGFYDAVRRLAALPLAARHAALLSE